MHLRICHKRRKNDTQRRRTPFDQRARPGLLS
jgi:hypothetical protein